VFDVNPIIIALSPALHSLTCPQGVKDNRITNLVIALDRVKLVLRQKDQCQNPPVRVLTQEETLAHLWNGDSSIVRRLVRVGVIHLEQHPVVLP
jgi:hypothetical protein